MMNFLHHYCLGFSNLTLMLRLMALTVPKPEIFAAKNCTEASFSNSTGSVQNEIFQDGNSILTMFITPRVVWSSGLVLLPKRHKKDISGFGDGHWVANDELSLLGWNCTKAKSITPWKFEHRPSKIYTKTIRKGSRIVFRAINLGVLFRC